MTTTTAKYGWQMPDPGGSANTWGNTLNATTQAIDQQVYTNAQAGVPVGTITMFGGATPPTNWLLCQGQSLATTGTYAGLFAVLQYTYGGSGANFNLPNLVGQFPLGAGPNQLGVAGGTFATSISVANLPSHSHSITEPGGGHTHVILQTPHSHGDPGHVHGIGDPTHVHNNVIAPGGGHYLPPGSSGVVADINPTPAAATGISQTASAGTGIQAATANINGNTTNAATTGITTTNAVGSGATWNVVPPYLAINFIIKYA